MGLVRYALTVLAVWSVALSAAAQARPDTLYLDDLQRAAEQVDRRAVQVDLLAKQSFLRLQSIRSERLPALSAAGTAQHLSDVAQIGAVLPGVRIPSPWRDQYDASLALRQPLVDPTRKRRISVEAAQTLESQARVRTALWQQRAAVSEAFFGVNLRVVQLRALDVAVADLDARLRVASSRVRAGTALPSEQLLLQAERARRLQSRDELIVERDATLEVLSALVGRELAASSPLAMRAPATIALLESAAADTLHARPEFAQFARARGVVEARSAVTTAQDLPRVSAFGRSGYGRPGLNPLGRNFDAYWTAGVQVEWTPWTWGRSRRELEVQALQNLALRSDEAAFRQSLSRAAIAERARINGLEGALSTDDSIVGLRDAILRETRLRYDEGEVSAADYIARLSEQLTAQLDRDIRRVRLDEARARYLTTLGLEVR
jgi:outer membrane protein TolC